MAPGNGGTGSTPGQQSVRRLQAWWDNYVVWQYRLRRIEADLFHVIDQGLAWYARYLRGGRRLITVHDFIAYMTWKKKLPFDPLPAKRIPVLRECARQIAAADALITDSQHTADCLMRELSVAARRITVVHNFLGEGLSPLAPDEWLQARKRWFSDAPYVVIHVGQPLVYKNRIGALRAFARLHSDLPSARMFLVPGPPTAEESELLRESPCSLAVRFLPPLTEPELRQLYGAADVLVFPSHYEGFGWPPLEAMACGCPVVCSNRGSLEEVVGDAAFTVSDPNDFEALARHLHEVLRDHGAAGELRSRGLDRATHFRPEKILAQVAEVYRALV